MLLSSLIELNSRQRSAPEAEVSAAAAEEEEKEGGGGRNKDELNLPVFRGFFFLSSLLLVSISGVVAGGLVKICGGDYRL